MLGLGVRLFGLSWELTNCWGPTQREGPSSASQKIVSMPLHSSPLLFMTRLWKATVLYVSPLSATPLGILKGAPTPLNICRKIKVRAHELLGSPWYDVVEEERATRRMQCIVVAE